MHVFQPSSEEESKRKITRSTARHIRRKRRISAKRAAENESSSVLTNIQSELLVDSKNSSNNVVEESLSKSKARRLRKRNKTRSVENLEKNCHDKTDIVDSPLRRGKPTNEDVVDSSTKSKPETVLCDSKNDIIGSKAIAKLPIGEKLTEREDDELSDWRKRSMSRDIAIFSKIIEQLVNPVEETLIVRETKTSFLGEPLSIRETHISSIAEKPKIVREWKVSNCSEIEAAGTSFDDVKTMNLTSNETSTRAIMSDTMSSQEKTREQVKAEREAKKAAKAASKHKFKEVYRNEADGTIVEYCKIREPRGDVVDGEILPILQKPATPSTIPTTKPEVIVETKNPIKSNSELRAERRAKQEAQRSAKLAAQTTEKTKPKVPNLVEDIKSTTVALKKCEISEKKFEEPGKKIEDSTKKLLKRPIVKENVHEVNLFKHLYHEREQSLVKVPTVNSNIHPAIVRLGVQYANKVIVGSNARCVALLAAIKQLVEDFERPSQADFTRGLEASLQESSAYLHHCRPLAVSMQNALKHLKWQMAHLSATMSDEEAKTKLGNAIDTYIQEQIQLADKAISITIQTKISNGDVILTYGYSSLIYKILCDAHDAGRQFRVVVVDGRPWLEGRELLRRLTKHGLECSYVLINALSFIMPEVSKVFLGAHAILANGAVMSRVGTAQVALMAKSFNVPVLVACETHKTCERVQTDSIVYNEIADPDELARNSMGITRKTSLLNWRGKKSLNLLNITYDVTPADLVTAVVTELAILPCTSVPVILRIKPSEI